MSIRRTWTLLVGLLLVGGCTSGCGPVGPSPHLTQEELAGTWANDQGATLEVNSDGTFTAAALRTCATKDEPLDFEPDSGQGTWELEAPETLSPYQTVNLRFGPPEKFAWDDWQADDDEIFFFIGDPDSNDRCTFRRK
ncbi:hypothetical protein [Micromonospora sp. NPDC005806]|uniref:hypothetical protein n=1 Tax=Micromonospora sp. NPDC005806 TaxID=3364234 RepID=UPI0036B7BBA2